MEESCGRCYPCQLGAMRQYEILKRVAEGRPLPGDRERLTKDQDALPKALFCLRRRAFGTPLNGGRLLRRLTFFDFPAEHRGHLRTTNPIESPFATVKARTRLTKGAGARNAALATAFKLALAAQGRWRKVNAPHLVALVRAGATFKDGALLTEAQPAAFNDTESTHEVAA